MKDHICFWLDHICFWVLIITVVLLVLSGGAYNVDITRFEEDAEFVLRDNEDEFTVAVDPEIAEFWLPFVIHSKTSSDRHRLRVYGNINNEKIVKVQISSGHLKIGEAQARDIVPPLRSTTSVLTEVGGSKTYNSFSFDMDELSVEPGENIEITLIVDIEVPGEGQARRIIVHRKLTQQQPQRFIVPKLYYVLGRRC